MKLRIILLISATLILSTQFAQAASVTLVGFTIQAGAFNDLSRAERLCNVLKAKGLEAAWYKKENGLHAVFFGNFKSHGEAKTSAERLKQEQVLGSFYITPAKKGTPVFGKHSSTSLQAGAGVVLGKIAAQTAERFVGVPYRWGGDNVVEGMDCSGFVKAVYYLVGLNIPRTSQEQFNAGTELSKADIRPGDLVFFGKGSRKITHVGLYLGGNRFVHAPRRNEPIQITSLDDERYSVKFVGARRMV
jgi:gamma-D-glutamyl-L-lysine dipeptidyl-peptidase